MNYTTCQGAFAGGFHTWWVCSRQHYGVQWSCYRWHCVDTLGENEVHCLIVDKVGYGLFELDSMFLIENCKGCLCGSERHWSIGWEVFGEALSRWTPTRTTTNWPFIILGLPSRNDLCQLLYVPWYLHVDLSKHVVHNVSRLCLRAHTMKVEAAAWHEDGSHVCDQSPGEDEHV